MRRSFISLLNLLLIGLLFVGCAGGLKKLTQSPEDLLAGVEFRSVRTLELPGPLPNAGPEIDDAELVLPVAGGNVRLPLPLTDAAPQIRSEQLAPRPEATPEDWVIGAGGTYRGRILAGRLELQRSCRRCKAGFRRVWRTRLPANSAVPPVIGRSQVYAGTLDNRLYAFRKRNGHRVWEADLGARIDRPLVGVDLTDDVRVLITTLRRNRRVTLLALNPSSGSVVASFELPEGDNLVGAPQPLPGGVLILAVQNYDRSRAALWELKIGSPAGSGQLPGVVSYNDEPDPGVPEQGPVALAISQAAILRE